MKIDHAIMAADDNPLYLDFWPIVSELWDRLGIVPVLCYFGKKNITKGNGIVIHFPDMGEKNYIATCWARYYMACQMEGVGIITDIDMLPFSHWYFKNQIEKYSNDSYLHLNPCIDTYSRLPSCYHVASGSVFKEVLQIENEFEKSLATLMNAVYNNTSCYVQYSRRHWCYDEYFATEMILTSSYKELHLINREGGQSGRRIDRTNWVYEDKLMKGEYYFDSHSIRPYNDYKKEIDKLIKLLP